MSEFICRLGTPSGDVRTEVKTSDDPEKLRKDLERQGFYVFSVSKKGVTLPSIKLRKRRKVKSQNFVIFNQELAALVHSGLPLVQCVEILWERQEDPMFRAVLAEVIDKLKSGESLSDAFATYGDVFPKMYATILKSGERSGDLEKVLRRFITYQKVILGVKRKVKGALIYPAILLTLSIVLIVIMMTYVIPKFTSFYGDMDATLPLITEWVIALSKYMIQNMAILGFGVVAGILVFLSWIRTPLGRRSFDASLLRLPFVGTIFHRFALTQFCRSLATLVEGGTPVVQALTISSNTISNADIATRVQEIVGRVQEGDALWNSLESTGKFTSIAIEMIKVGESTGSLETMLHNAADFYDEEIDIRLQRIVTLVEPIMLVFMGTVVAVLLAAVYLPLLTLIGQMR
ncbi:MAG TPA: type II secretion system F family protein [Thermoanaerobaculia bacterium]|nr:type II secretion system F family protein [Thermoanaerobaculia bacterium]HUM31285.1 type II secretion system F family protein [Thermoanaerobaculia bacterium]HXK69644.1 type II secretion system F family protein [Thermoanaerobaculia bacterium]